MVCSGRPYHFKLFKGCLPQILLGPFLNTLTHLNVKKNTQWTKITLKFLSQNNQLFSIKRKDWI